MPSNLHNEALKHNKAFAQQVHQTYCKVLKELSDKATLGDKVAARKLMEKMSEEYGVLYHLGFTLGDTGRLRKL